MEQKSSAAQEAALLDKGTIVRNYGSWSIKLYRKKKRMVIEALDYHADPLLLSRDELCDLARLMGLHVRRRKNQKQQGIS